MEKDRSSISKAKSYQEIGAFWDDHDLADYWDQTEPVTFEMDIQSEEAYCALPDSLSDAPPQRPRSPSLPRQTGFHRPPR